MLDADLSNEAFPFSTHQLVRAAGHLVGGNGLWATLGNGRVGLGVWYLRASLFISLGLDSQCQSEMMTANLTLEGAQRGMVGSRWGHVSSSWCLACAGLIWGEALLLAQTDAFVPSPQSGRGCPSKPDYCFSASPQTTGLGRADSSLQVPTSPEEATSPSLRYRPYNIVLVL